MEIAIVHRSLAIWTFLVQFHETSLSHHKLPSAPPQEAADVSVVQTKAYNPFVYIQLLKLMQKHVEVAKIMVNKDDIEQKNKEK